MANEREWKRVGDDDDDNDDDTTPRTKGNENKKTSRGASFAISRLDGKIDKDRETSALARLLAHRGDGCTVHCTWEGRGYESKIVRSPQRAHFLLGFTPSRFTELNLEIVAEIYLEKI